MKRAEPQMKVLNEVELVGNYNDLFRVLLVLIHDLKRHEVLTSLTELVFKQSCTLRVQWRSRENLKVNMLWEYFLNSNLTGIKFWELTRQSFHLAYKEGF